MDGHVINNNLYLQGTTLSYVCAKILQILNRKIMQGILLYYMLLHNVIKYASVSTLFFFNLSSVAFFFFSIAFYYLFIWAFQVVKNPPADAGDIRNMGLISQLGRSPGGGHGKPCQCSCLENPMDRGTWPAIVLRVAKSWTQLKQLSTHTSLHITTIFKHLFL